MSNEKEPDIWHEGSVDKECTYCGWTTCTPLSDSYAKYPATCPACESKDTLVVRDG